MASARSIALGIIAFIVIVVAIALVINYTGKGGVLPIAQSSSKSVMALQLTDPPQVPAGTQSLIVYYSSVMVHTTGASGAGWIKSNSSGQVNLLSLLNLTQTIATVSVPNNSEIDMARFNITSATITVNGTTYNVTLPSRMINANVSGSQNASNSSSLLISLSPTVVTILTDNSTVFVLVPSLDALIVPHGTTQSTIVVGDKISLQEHVRSRLDDIRPNITLTGATLTVAGNTTKFSVTVNNNGNRSVTIKHIGISGNASVSINASYVNSYTQRIGEEAMNRIRNSTVCSNLSINHTINLSIQDMPKGDYNYGTGSNFNATADVNSIIHGGMDNQYGMYGNVYSFGKGDELIQGGLGFRYNNSMCTSPGFMEFENVLNAKLMNLSYVQQVRQRNFRLLSFIVSGNGALAVPYSIDEFNDVELNDSGYVIGPMQSHTFNFTGTISIAGMRIVVKPIAGDNYTVYVRGEEEAYVSANVTASGS